jgi:DNA repair ATPase RecN
VILDEQKVRLVQLQVQRNQFIKRRKDLQDNVESLKRRFSTLSDTETILGEAAQSLKSVAEICEASSKNLIERVINHGLGVIFGEREKFRVYTETKARSVYAYMCLGEGTKSGIIDSRGGGYVDIISVLTVLVLILQQRPNVQRFLVLDEAFAEVGAEHLSKVGEFLRFLVDKLDLTILLVTHSEQLAEAATKVYNVSMKDGVTTIKEGKFNA